MRPEDKRLVADLILLGDRLGPILDEVLAGQFDDEERRALAGVLATLAGELDPEIVLSTDAPGIRERPAIHSGQRAYPTGCP